MAGSQLHWEQFRGTTPKQSFKRLKKHLMKAITVRTLNNNYVNTQIFFTNHHIYFN